MRELAYPMFPLCALAPRFFCLTMGNARSQARALGQRLLPKTERFSTMPSRERILRSRHANRLAEAAAEVVAASPRRKDISRPNSYEIGSAHWSAVPER